MTYNVFSGTLNPAQSVIQSVFPCAVCDVNVCVCVVETVTDCRYHAPVTLRDEREEEQTSHARDRCHAKVHTETQAHRQTYTHTDTQAYRQTYTPPHRDTSTQTDIHTHRHKHTDIDKTGDQ